MSDRANSSGGPSQKTRRAYAKVGILLGVAVTALAATAATVWFWPKRLWNPLSEPIVAFQQGQVAERDPLGFWSISAPTGEDASYALGYLLAHDRLFQFDMARRSGAGRLAEVLGEDLLGTDMLHRSYGYSAIADQDLSVSGWLSQPENSDLRSQLERFIEGVNDYVSMISSQWWAWPPEYRILRTRPEPFSLKDSLFAMASMHLYFNGARRSDLSNTYILRNHADKLGLFFGPLPSVLPTAEDYLSTPLRWVETTAPTRTSPSEQTSPERVKGPTQYAGSATHTNSPWPAGRLSQAIKAAMTPPLTPAGLSAVSGSNAWLCRGDRTQSGKPMLANDPHLGVGLPSFLSAARVETPEHSFVGAFVPLAPFPVIGFSQSGAWGLTYSEIDQSDFYELQLNADTLEEADSYRFENSWRPLQKRTETIRVKGAEDLKHVFAETHIGPVQEVPKKERASKLPRFVVLADASLKPGNKHLKTLFQLSRVKTAKQFSNSLKNHVAPPHNAFWVGANDEVAWGLAGAAVQRDWSPERALRTLLPASTPQEVSALLQQAPQLALLPGGVLMPLRNEFIWTGTQPAANFALSQEFASGCFGNANEAPSKRWETLPALASANWALGMRSGRIKQMLKATPRHSVASFQSMQLDITDNLARVSLPRILDFLRSQKQVTEGGLALSAEGAEVLERLEQWDYRAEASRGEQLLFETLLSRWRERVFEVIAERDLVELYRMRSKHNARLLLSWTQLLQSVSPISGKGVLGAALVEVANGLKQHYDQEGLSWANETWGRHHTFGPKHPLAQIPLLGQVFAYPDVPASGSNTSLRVQGYRGYLSAKNRQVKHGAGLRMVVSPSEEKAWMMFPSGASGVPGSPWFRAHQESYVSGEYAEVPLRRSHTR